jgi:hypothetical protein
VVPAGLINVSSAPVADGLTVGIFPPDVGIGGDIIIDTVPPAPYAAIVLSNQEPSRIIVNGAEWSCGMIAASSSTLINSAERVERWLPDGDYRCETNGDQAQPRYVTLGSSTLTVQAPDYAPAGSYAAIYGTRMSAFSTSFYIPLTVDLLSHYSYALESVDDPLGQGELEDWGHTHEGDDIAATLYPYSSLLLAVPPVIDGTAPESLRAYRSLVTGKGYFEFTTDGLALRHCQRHVPVVSSGSISFSSGSGLGVSGGSLTMNAVSLGSGSYGIYQPAYLTPYNNITLSPHGEAPANCYGALKFC